jgi:hypothetical protein
MEVVDINAVFMKSVLRNAVRFGELKKDSNAHGRRLAADIRRLSGHSTKALCNGPQKDDPTNGAGD